jgi:hypothetical protein
LKFVFGEWAWSTLANVWAEDLHEYEKLGFVVVVVIHQIHFLKFNLGEANIYPVFAQDLQSPCGQSHDYFVVEAKFHFGHVAHRPILM